MESTWLATALLQLRLDSPAGVLNKIWLLTCVLPLVLLLASIVSRAVRNRPVNRSSTMVSLHSIVGACCVLFPLVVVSSMVPDATREHTSSLRDAAIYLGFALILFLELVLAEANKDKFVRCALLSSLNDVTCECLTCYALNIITIALLAIAHFYMVLVKLDNRDITVLVLVFTPLHGLVLSLSSPTQLASTDTSQKTEIQEQKMTDRPPGAIKTRVSINWSRKYKQTSDFD